MNKTTNKTAKGFTLIEILVVIGIVAILAAIVLIAINPARQFSQANDSQRTSNVNSILNGIGQFVADSQGTLPADVPAAGAAAVDVTEDMCDDLVPTYLPSLPTDPASFFEGAGITTCADLTPAGQDTGYTVSQDANGRITVSAQAEIDQDDDGDVDANDVISVTR